MKHRGHVGSAMTHAAHARMHAVAPSSWATGYTWVTSPKHTLHSVTIVGDEGGEASGEASGLASGCGGGCGRGC